MTPSNTRTFEQLVRAAKRNEWTKAHGGFAVATLSNGTIDWFPVGVVPYYIENDDEVVDRTARIIAKFRYVNSWKQIA